MIYFVSTHSHRYTHAVVAKARLDFRRVSYPALFTRRRLPRGTYIFSDFDRLGFFQLELAAHIYRVLKAAGCPVLNDPARALHRLALLERLHRLQINSFKAWSATDVEDVDRFPVFIRTASAHRGVLTNLLGTKASLLAALDSLVATGYPIADLIVVEYRARAIRSGIFRKLAVYRIGDILVPSASVHEPHWTAKQGKDGIAGAQGYAEDLALVQGNPHADLLHRAFKAARIDYGRADFGIVEGRPEIYEINTNPMIYGSLGHPNADRAEAMRLTDSRYHEAMAALPRASGGEAVRVPSPASFRPQHAYLGVLRGLQWMP